MLADIAYAYRLLLIGNCIAWPALVIMAVIAGYNRGRIYREFEDEDDA